MTGAPLPVGADRVVALEHTDGGQQTVTLGRKVPAGEAVRLRGEVLRAGDEFLPAGARLTPRPRPARHPWLRGGAGASPSARGGAGNRRRGGAAEREPGPGQLRDSHTDFLTAAAGMLRLEVESLGIARDDPEELAAGVSRGLGADLLLVCGGVSKGEFDLVEGVLEQLGCERVFDEVAIQPGRPLVFARHAGGLVLGLPGNPAAVMVCFWLFARPLLRRWLGLADGFWHGALGAGLSAALPGARDRDRFLPAEVTAQAGALQARPIATRGSHDLAAYARGNSLVRVPAGSPPRGAGASCEVLPLGDGP